MSLILHRPLLMSNLFSIPLDTTTWNVGSYIKIPGAQTPNRKRASFITLNDALKPKNDCGKLLDKTYGIYILAFDVPHCHLYVGIAAKGGKSDEGVFSRIRKHRVKATGSHIGASESKCGGVNHTRGWRHFATCRAIHFLKHGQADVLGDARLVIGSLSEGDQRKVALEAYENAIFLNKGNILGRIRQALWPDGCIAHSLITVRATPRDESCGQIELWNESGPDFCNFA